MPKTPPGEKLLPFKMPDANEQTNEEWRKRG
jgi:hypothetical protein